MAVPSSVPTMWKGHTADSAAWAPQTLMLVAESSCSVLVQSTC